MSSSEGFILPTQTRSRPGGPGAGGDAAHAPFFPHTGGTELIPTLLQALAGVGGFDAAFICAVDRTRGVLEVRDVHNAHSAEVPTGVTVELPVGFPERAYLGVTRSAGDAPADPDSLIAQALGLATYASVPIITADYQLFGMLCGASRAPHQVSDDTVAVMEFFSRLIVDQMVRDAARHAARRAQTAEQQLRERAMFLAQAEHMLKTPLMIIDGYVDRLDRADVPAEERSAAMAMLRRNTRQLAVQIDRLLEEVKAEVRARDLHPVKDDLLTATEALVTAHNQATGSRRVRFCPAADAPVWVDIDPALLDHVIAHLLDNAIKYSEPHVPVEVSVGEEPPWALITVTDQGIGLPDGIDVFAAFQRGQSRATAERPGIGLGLHIVRNLLHAMGGEITAAPNPEKGSTFTVHLPLTG